MLNTCQAVVGIFMHLCTCIQDRMTALIQSSPVWGTREALNPGWIPSSSPPHSPSHASELALLHTILYSPLG